MLQKLQMEGEHTASIKHFESDLMMKIGNELSFWQDYKASVAAPARQVERTSQYASMFIFM